MTEPLLSREDHLRLSALHAARESLPTGSSPEIVVRATEFFRYLSGEPQSDTAEKPKRTRKPGAETPADEKAAGTATAAASSTPAQTSAPASAQKEPETKASDSFDDFLGEDTPKEEEKKYEQKDVRVALVDLQTKVSREVAMEALKTGGAENIPSLKPEKYGVVMKAVADAIVIGEPLKAKNVDPETIVKQVREALKKYAK